MEGRKTDLACTHRLGRLHPLIRIELRGMDAVSGIFTALFDETSITLLSFGLQRNYYIKNVVLFEENSILLLPERLESSEW